MYYMKEIFLNVLDMGVAGGWVILAVLAVRMLLGRVPKKITCLLWIPVGLRLVIPWRVASPVSLFNLVRPAATEVTEYGTAVQKFIPEDIGMAADPQISVGIPAADAVLSGSLPDATPAVSMNPMQFWEAAGTVFWCAGMAVMAVWALVQYIRLRRRVRTAVRMEGEENVYLSENVSSPFLLGGLRPKIYLPYGLDGALTEQVLLHERTHLRYGDPLTKLLAYGILTVYWFHPLCWLAFCLFCRDVEMRCDEAVLEQTEAEKYGKALVLLASGRRVSVTGPLAFGESSVKERVRHILAWKKPALWVSIGAIAVSVVLFVVCGTDGMESPYAWTSTITAEDIGETFVRHRGEGVWEAELTPEQTETLVQCLRQTESDSIRPGAEKQHFPEMVMDVRIRYRVTENSSVQYVFRYDGEEVYLCSADPSVLGGEPAWYFRDADLLAFFGTLAEFMESGQGTLVPDSAAVSVTISGTDTVIVPQHYEAGQWDYDYSELPALTMTESGYLCIHAYWQPETLYVYEEYYNSLSASSTAIRRNTYTADGPHTDGGYTFPVTWQNPSQDEQAVYYITNGEEKYIFMVYFTDSAQDTVYTFPIEKAPVPEESPVPLSVPLYIFTADTAPADAYLTEQYGTAAAEGGAFTGAIRIFHGGDNTVGEAQFWLPMYAGGEMYKLQYVSVDEAGQTASSYVLESSQWDSIHLLAELTSPEEPMMLVQQLEQQDEILYAVIGNTAYWLPQWKEPEGSTFSALPIGFGEGTVVAFGADKK